MLKKIYTTIGIYPNGSFKTNGVSEDHLSYHIEYNKKWRPGRSLVVDNKIIYQGYLTEAQILEIITKNNLQRISFNKSTAPHS